MANLILFHHIQGLTAGVEAFADRVREAGHTVTVPDLYGGATFPTMKEGFAHAQLLGSSIDATAAAAASELPDRIVYAGFSMGAMSAHQLAQTRPGALGALLYHHGDVPIDTFGESWPTGVDVQIHVSEHDEFFDPEIAEEFITKAGAEARAELFTYPGSGHLFADSSLPEYEPESSAQLIERTLEFLGRYG